MDDHVRANGKRRYRSREEAEQVAAEFEASGLTQRAFCEHHAVSVSALSRYVKRWRQRLAEGDAGPQWVTVEVAEQDAAGSGVTVVLRGGRRVEVGRGFDTTTLGRLVLTLEEL